MAMSCFSTQLKVALERTHISRDELAKASGLSYSMVTNLANDRREPDGEILEALAKGLPEDVMADLLVALWCDVCPESLRSLVHIIPARESLILEEPVQVYNAPQLDAELDGAIERMKRAAIRHPEWRAAVITWSKTASE